MDEPPSKIFLESVFTANNLVVWSAVVVLLLFVAAFLAASESAFFSLRGDDLQRLENSRDQKEKVVARLLGHPHSLWLTIIILTSIVDSAVIVISGLWLKSFSNDQISQVVSFSATIIVVFFISVFAVILPQVYASRNYSKFTSRIAGIWSFFLRLFHPFLLLGRKRDDVVLMKGTRSSADGLNEMLVQAVKDEESAGDEQEILKGIVNFGTLTVRQVMRSRVDIAALDITLNFHELMNLINKSGFSRMPVYRDTVDKIEGVLYIKDLLPFIDHDENFRWQKLVRSGFFVPENKKVDVLLKDFQRRRVHMAIVVDEYGGTLGLITLEDIIEEIIGEINDEFDDETSPFRRISENTFVFEGKTSLRDFCKVLDIGPEIFDDIKGEYESLGGLILELNKQLPSVGKKISFDQFTFIVEAVDKKRIKRIRVHVHEQKESD